MSARIHSTSVCNWLAAFKDIRFLAILSASNLKSAVPLCIDLLVVD